MTTTMTTAESAVAAESAATEAMAAAEPAAAAESAAEATRSAAEAPCHAAAGEATVETRCGLERSALRGDETPCRSSLRRSATEALRSDVAWHCVPVPKLCARPSALERVPAGEATVETWRGFERSSLRGS